MKYIVIAVMIISMCLTGCADDSNKPVDTPANNEQNVVDTPAKVDENITDTPAKVDETKVSKPEIVFNSKDITNGETENFETEVSCISVEGTDYDYLNKVFEEINNKRIEDYTALYNEYKDLLSEVQFDQPFSIKSELKLFRNDESIISFVDELYTNFGGAHPSTMCTGYNIDAKSGKLLDVGDVVKDYDRFCKLVEETLSNHEYKDGFYEDYKDIVEKCLLNSKDNEYGMTWYMTEDKIVILFNEYAIAPYAVGSIKCEFAYDEYGDIFYHDYLPE